MTNFNTYTYIYNKESIHRSFAGAMVNGFISNFVFKGIQGNPQANFDFFDITLASIQSGVSHISYRAAVETISRFNEDFKRIKEDPKNRSQVIVYMAGSSLGALYATGINYPINCIREFRNNKNFTNKEFKMSFKEAKNFYADRVFGYIGFATSMAKIVPLIPDPRNKFQNRFAIQMAHLNGMLTAYPYKLLKENVEFGPYVRNNLKSFAIKMISGNLSSHLQKEIDMTQNISY